MKWGATFTENLGIKFTALLFALALYAHVVTEQPVEQVIYFPLQVEGLGDTLALRAPPPDQIGARLRGTGKEIIRLRVLRPAVVIDLSGASVGQFQRPLTEADLKEVTKEGVEIVGPPRPGSITLHVEPKGTLRLPVQVRLRGEPARGYVMTAPPSTRPEEVRLSGPASRLRGWDSVETEPLVLTGKHGRVESVLPLVAPPPWATVSPGSVLVEVAIEPEASGSRELTPEVVGLRPGFVARLNPARVRLLWSAPKGRGPAPTSDLRATIDVERRGRGRYVLPVRLSGRDRGAVRAVMPDSVAVTVQ